MRLEAEGEVDVSALALGALERHAGTTAEVTTHSASTRLRCRHTTFGFSGSWGGARWGGMEASSGEARGHAALRQGVIEAATGRHKGG
ncbi:hypothetical protein GUJ93_ZPchr0009g2265 [Zizania palustris]|uniref:Uncharacterized protein n=1 Tax=Zizania palustris TaxID=103762 RepID=A0A8J5V8H2_ZIZPA|nr:hypothetical protein GUJ93_ZPchr0009g2265 [Zizania palustris]